MTRNSMDHIFDESRMNTIFPDSISNRFFDALLGDAEEGAYDIRLRFKQRDGNQLQFQFELARRADKCLRCSLTYGLPEVFSRHPIINLKGLAAEIDRLLDGSGRVDQWKLGKTVEISSDLHVIPFTLFLNEN